MTSDTEKEIAKAKGALARISIYLDDDMITRLFDTAIKALSKQYPRPPIPDENATGIDGKPVPRCQVCGYALDLRMEQYCPCCGQRLTEYPETEVKG